MATSNDTPRTIEIQLTKGYVTIVDEQDADLNQHKWQALINSSGNVYATSNNQLMHRIILGRVLGRELTHTEEVDHKNRVGIDNTRANLRLATRKDNARNIGTRNNSLVGLKGVRRNRCGYFEARITTDYQKDYLGTYDTSEDAAIAYNHAAAERFGDFASFNDIQGWRNRIPTPREKFVSMRRSNKSGYANVNFHKSAGKWHARVLIGGERISVGFFDTPEQANNARLKYLEEHS